MATAPVCALAADLPPIESPLLDLRAASASRDNLLAFVNLLVDPNLRGRNAGSSENRRVAALIARAFAGFGLSAPAGGDHCVSFVKRGVEDQNVVGHLFGRADAPVVLIGAHYDAQGTDGRDVFPGADDNASGVSALLEIARLTASRSHGVNLVFVAFGAEEKGILGSKAYVAAPSLPLSRLALMVNLDMVGRPFLDGSPLRLVLPRADETLGFVIGDKDKRKTADLLDRAASLEDRPMVGIPESLLTRFGFSSDSVPFSPHTPTIFLSTTDHEDYHKPTDTPEKIDPEQIARTVRLVLRILDEVAAESNVSPRGPA